MNVCIVSSLAVLSVAVCGALAFPEGWNEIAIDDAKIVELADWAVGEIGNGYSLLEIRGAEYQGNNLRSTCIVTIYENLEGGRTLNEPYPCTRG